MSKKSQMMNLRVTANEAAWIHDLANEYGTSVSSLIRFALRRLAFDADSQVVQNEYTLYQLGNSITIRKVEKALTALDQLDQVKDVLTSVRSQLDLF